LDQLCLAIAASSSTIAAIVSSSEPKRAESTLPSVCARQELLPAMYNFTAPVDVERRLWFAETTEHCLGMG
jgi:hypothetical protein